VVSDATRGAARAIAAATLVPEVVALDQFGSLEVLFGVAKMALMSRRAFAAAAPSQPADWG